MRKYLEKNEKIKKGLVAANAVLIVGAIVASIAYSRSFREESNRLQKENFCTTIESMKQLSENYLAAEKAYADDWVAYIMHEHMTMEEALTYIRTSNTRDNRYAHFVNMDDFAAQSSYIINDSEWLNCYKDFVQSSYNSYKIMERKMWKMFEGDDSELQVLGKYRIGSMQQTVISVGTRVEIAMEDGTTKPYLLLRVIPVEDLKSTWVFPTDYQAAEVSLITNEGEYVVQSASMKSRSLLDYIRGYNFEDDYNKVEDLAEQIRTTKKGLMRYKNHKGEECYWYYSSLGDDTDLDILGYIPAGQIDNVNMNWSIVGIICGSLFLLVCMDGAYILSINRRLHKTAAVAERANLAKTEFLSTMSHDIRTPMNAVIGMTDIAKKHLDDPAYVEDCLNKVSYAGNHLLTLINDILDISKVESGKMALNEHAFSLQEALDEAVSIIKPKAEEKNITFTVEKQNVEKDMLVADQLRLNQILINLLTNAVKYTNADGHVVLSVSEEETDSPDKIRLLCRVKDDGIGMSEEFQKQMYSSFSRAEDSRIDKIQGSGLGLTITKNLVDLMNGSITCTSEPGKGTEFAVSLELKTADARSEEDEYTADGTEGSEYGDISSMHVLIAEDNDMNWEIIDTLLKEHGVSCERASDGQECIDMLTNAKAGHFDLVLMDIQMPVMNGKDAARAIRQNKSEAVRHIPIVAMTADAFAEDIKECLDAGMNAHIAKPIDMKQVLRILRQIKYEQTRNTGREK